MERFTTFIIKYPVKILLLTLIIALAIGIGISKISLNTGNDTLISDDSDIYLDNQSYQITFGKDPIILIFDQQTTYDFETLNLMNGLHEEITDFEGVFSVNSPVTIVNQISASLYDQTNTGLLSIGNGLSEMATQMQQLSTNMLMNESDDSFNIEQMNAMITQMISSSNTLGIKLESNESILSLTSSLIDDLNADVDNLMVALEDEPENSEELSLANDIEDLVGLITTYTQQLVVDEEMIALPNQIATSFNQVLIALSNIENNMNEQVTAIEEIANVLSTLGTNLEEISNQLLFIQSNFNAFEPTFPKTEETLENIIYDNGEIRSSLQSFIVGENQLRMVIVLDESATDEQIDMIATKLETYVEQQDKEDEVLISGKPILDRSIKSSMMESMQSMMILAVVMMILILSIIYKVRMKLFPILMIFIAVIVTVGMMGWLSIGLTMVSMAVFPVLIGLGIDYFIQFQTRYEEEMNKL
jgi:predicted RND superfamily exporter protein